MRPLHGAVVGAFPLALVAGGCGGARPGSDGGPVRLKLTGSPAARFLVDGGGHALYLFGKGGRGESHCAGACAAVWPSLETHPTPTAAAGVNGSALGLIRRARGSRSNSGSSPGGGGYG